jgi:threonylcarbamoyladenosine tRNA methylthiotransferase MtaB
MTGRMATFHIENFGCRATYADAAAIEQQFLESGYRRADGPAQADLVVLNTCTVTADADAVARQAIRRAHRENPGARIVVSGCYAQRAPEELAAIVGVSLVVGNSHLTQIADFVGQASKPVPQPVETPALVQIATQARRNLESTSNVANKTGQTWTSVLKERTRPILKIQDGCDQRCAYCVIPFVRGRSRSLPPAEAVAEVRRLVAGGAKEIVLSGINLGSYGRDLEPRADLLSLLRRILGETTVERLRLSSIEPADVTRELVELFASSERLARHFHVPLQSGSDRVLRAMHRWYKAAHYAERIKLIQETLPGAGIGADVIAGFPGETDEDHCATMEFVASLPFSYLHVFGYSERPGTEAARLIAQDRVPLVAPPVIKRRVRELRALGAGKAQAFRSAQGGMRLRALTLHTQGQSANGSWTAALTDNYLTVQLPGRLLANQWRNALIPING